MAWHTLRLGLLLLFLTEVRTQVPAGGTGVAAAGTPGAAGAGATGTPGASGTYSTMTNRAEHPFCNRPPMPQSPKMPIFHMDVKTGFLNGYRSNQSVVVEITAKYPEVWRIHQVFFQVPNNRPYTTSWNHHSPASSSKVVGHWVWNLIRNNKDPDVGGTKPVDCGGMTSYGPYGMLSWMGAHAAMQIKQPSDDPNNNKGFTKIIAKWVPPSNWENIIYRKMITIEAYVTFEKTPPTSSYHHFGPQPARWIKKEASLLNLDYIDIHNYFQRFRPYMNMMQKFMVAIKR